jgi:hypothetical protein
MKICEFLARIEKKEFFERFKREFSDSFLCAVFCILTKSEKEGDKIHFDFYIPSKKKVAFTESPFSEICFSQEDGKEFSELKDLEHLKVDILDLWDEIEKIKKDKGITNKTSKLIGILAGDSWNLTCLSDSLEIIKLKINAYTKEILSIRKAGLGEFMKINSK